MDSPFDLNLLRIFEMLLEEESATRVAARLEISQAAVSAALARLRQVYGDLLFYRAGRGLAPTPRALALAPEVRRAMEAARATLAGRSSQRAFVLIGLSDDVEIAFGAALMAGLAAALPQITPVFRQTHSGVAAEMLHARQLDFAIGSGGLTGRGLTRSSLGTSSYLTLAIRPPDEGAFSLEEFCARPHLLISSSGLTGLVDSALAALGRRRQVAAATTHFSAAPFLLRGELIVTLPAHAARAIAAKGGFWIGTPPLDLGQFPMEIAARSADLRAPDLRQCLAVVRTVFTDGKERVDV